jgi:putative membrane protein
VLIVKTQGLDPWGPSLAWIWGVLYGAAMVLGYSLGSLSAVQRWLLPASEQKEAVEQRALLEFYAAHLDRTERGTGILLFVSLLEHRAVVLADKGIAQHCQPKVFDDVVEDLIQGAKSGDLAAGFVQAIARSADLLAPHFPPLATDKNELKDYLRIKE